MSVNADDDKFEMGTIKYFQGRFVISIFYFAWSFQWLWPHSKNDTILTNNAVQYIHLTTFQT